MGFRFGTRSSKIAGRKEGKSVFKGAIVLPKRGSDLNGQVDSDSDKVTLEEPRRADSEMCPFDSDSTYFLNHGSNSLHSIKIKKYEVEKNTLPQMVYKCARIDYKRVHVYFN